MKMYWTGNRKNIIGTQVRAFRKAAGLTQKQLASKLQLAGYDCTDLTILRIENGTRFVPDYEVVALANIFHVPYASLLDQP